MASILGRAVRGLRNALFGNPAEAYFADDRNWVDCSRSSNVKAIAYYIDVRRGGQSLLAVKFKAKGKQPERSYRYEAPVSVYTAMLAASSRGKFVHAVLNGLPYWEVT